MKKNLLLYFIWGFLLFFILRFPHATPTLGKVGNLVLVILFFPTSISVIRLLPKVSSQTRITYLLMLFMVLIRYISRYFNHYAFTELIIYRDFLAEIVLINLFSFVMIKNYWRKLEVINIILILYALINFVSIIVFPNGIVMDNLGFPTWFLGGKNMIIRTLIPAIIVNCMCSYHSQNRLTIRNYFLILLCVVSVILSGLSSTSILVMGIIIAGIVSSNYMSTLKPFNVFNILIVFILVSMAIIMFDFQRFFSHYFEAYFGKDSSLSGRDVIWQFALVRIFESPIIGYGYHTVEEWRDILTYSISLTGTAAHPHNYLLFMILQGGLVFFCSLIILCYILSKKYRISDNNVYYYLTLMYFCYFVEGTTESITSAPLMFPMFGLFISLYENKKREFHISKTF